MNELNYTSLPLSRKLVENGIDLKTEAVFCSDGLSGSKYDLIQRPLFPYKEQYPAPSFAELWRELPVSIERDGITYNKTLKGFRDVNVATYESLESRTVELFLSANPSDALAELLIWVKGREKG